MSADTGLKSLSQLQDDVYGMLAAQGYFSDINVMVESQGDFLNKLERTLNQWTAKAGKAGAMVIVGAATADGGIDGIPGPQIGDLRVNCTVIENVLLNTGTSGTGKAALDIAFYCAHVLHLFKPAGTSQSLIWKSLRPTASPTPNTISYVVSFGARLSVSSPVRVATPAIAVGTGPVTVTLTCATSGAAIYYTTDDTFPWSGNTTATLYAAPVTVTASCNIRACAHKAGSISSDVAWAVVTV